MHTNRRKKLLPLYKGPSMFTRNMKKNLVEFKKFHQHSSNENKVRMLAESMLNREAWAVHFFYHTPENKVTVSEQHDALIKALENK